MGWARGQNSFIRQTIKDLTTEIAPENGPNLAPKKKIKFIGF
jgi:hypothetical protein